MAALLSNQLLLYLTALSVCLATCAFLLQWRGDPEVPVSDHIFPAERNMSSIISPVDCEDILGRSKEPSFPYYSWRPASGPGLSHNTLKICVASTISAGLEQILPWIFYHKIVGITHFFLFVEGEAASNNVSIVLESIPEVKLIFRTKELEEQQAKSRAWNEYWLDFYFYKPCNHELFVKQTLNIEMAIEMAREAGMDWIIHIDTDELLHPAGTKNYSVQELLSEVPQNVDGARFLNYESCVERNDIKDPFSEVSMFKRNPSHIFPEIFEKYFDHVLRGSEYYYLTYVNGKSGARIQDGLRSSGAHDFYSYTDKYNEANFEEASVLHYSYNKFSELTSRAKRCRCKPTREHAKRCFLLDFDLEAYILASASTQEEMLGWYEEHIVWYDAELNAELVHAGVFERIYDPMVIIQGLKESGIFADVIASAWKKHELNQKS